MNEFDLTYLYKNEESWNNDLEEIKSIIPLLQAYKGKLHDEKMLKEYLLKEESIESKIYHVYQYAHLKSDINKKDVKNSANYSKVLMLFNQMNEALSFESPEILSLGEERVMKFLDNNSDLEYYRFIFQKLFHLNAHVLEEEKEKLISYFDPIASNGRNLYSSLAVADNKDKEIKLSNKQKVVVTQGNWRSLVADSKNPKDRKKIFEAIFTKYEENKNIYAEIYNQVMTSEKASAKARNYKSILEANLYSNNIPTKVYTNLLDVASNNSGAIKKYYDLRKKYLGLTNHYSYDRFIDLAYSNKKYSFDDAKKLFFESIKNCPVDFQNKAHEVLKDGFVDVYEKDGKRSGAYSSSVPSTHPFILLNYASTLDDVFTVAHESGHSIHSLYSQESQPDKLQDYTIFVAEIASTFNEHMLLDYLLSLPSITNDEKIILLQKQIDDIIATFYRQTLFAHYEYEVSKLVMNDEPINHEVLSNIMINLYKKYYGLNIKKEKYKQYVWAYIPHLYYTPFYVYQYATSFAASFALYKNVIEKKENAFEKYLGLLKSGGSKYPMEQTKEAGIDFLDKNTFMAVVERLNTLVDNLEKLLEAK